MGTLRLTASAQNVESREMGTPTVAVRMAPGKTNVRVTSTARATLFADRGLHHRRLHHRRLVQNHQSQPIMPAQFAARLEMVRLIAVAKAERGVDNAEAATS